MHIENNQYPSYYPMGDRAIVAQFENIISIDVSRKIQSFLHMIKKQDMKGITELLPAYNNLTIVYNPVVIKYDELIMELKKIERDISDDVKVESKTIHLPVAFGGEYGLDIDEIAERADLTSEEVITMLHSKKYYVYMIGFIAGYPYCGNIDEKLRFKRRANPRMSVKKGTVQIADKQVGICTMDAPSGWHLAGWTPMEVFNPHHLPPGLLNAGDYVKLEPVSTEFVQSWDEEKEKEWNREWNM